MIDVILNDYDSRLMDMYFGLNSTDTIACYGNEWIVNTPERTLEFKTYKSFIHYIEDELKEQLLNWAFNRELDELAEVDAFKKY